MDAFTRAGYAWIGLDHFARADDPLTAAQRNGALHRNFMGYTTMPASHLVGVGMSAISDVAGCFAQNDHQLGGWRERVRAGRLATIRGHTLTVDDHLRRRAIGHLMCNLELPLAFSPVPPLELRALLAPFEADGLVHFEPNRLVVTPLGRFFVRNLAMRLDAHLPAQRDTTRFSRTM